MQTRTSDRKTGGTLPALSTSLVKANLDSSIGRTDDRLDLLAGGDLDHWNWSSRAVSWPEGV